MQTDIWSKSTSGRENSKGKGPKARACLVGLRNSKEASEWEHNKGGGEELERSSEVKVQVGCNATLCRVL